MNPIRQAQDMPININTPVARKTKTLPVVKIARPALSRVMSLPNGRANGRAQC